MIVLKRFYRSLLFSMSSAVSETTTEPMTDSGLGINPEKAPPMMFADDFQKELEQSPEWQEMEKSLKVKKLALLRNMSCLLLI